MKEAEDVVITEVNANALNNVTVTLFKNNQTITLVEGTDYEVSKSGGDGSWYQYVYTIYKKNFTDDGVYRLSIHSEDDAGNVAENTLDTKGTEINFGVDKTIPNAVVTNIENGETYAVENITVKLLAEDNLVLASVVVYLDDYSKVYASWNAEQIAEILAANGEFTFDISGDSTNAHNLKIVCTDAAGNEYETEVEKFYVTTNKWVNYYNNKPLFYGTIIGVLVLISGIVLIIVLKRRKKEKKAA